jgi:hypothetical protein
MKYNASGHRLPPRRALSEPFEPQQGSDAVACKVKCLLPLLSSEEAASDGLVRRQVRAAEDMVRHASLILRDHRQGFRSDRLGFWPDR